MYISDSMASGSGDGGSSPEFLGVASPESPHVYKLPKALLEILGALQGSPLQAVAANTKGGPFKTSKKGKQSKSSVHSKVGESSKRGPLDHPSSGGTAHPSPVKKSKKNKKKKSSRHQVSDSESGSDSHVDTEARAHHPPKVLSVKPLKRKADEVEDLKRQIASMREEISQQAVKMAKLEQAAGSSIAGESQDNEHCSSSDFKLSSS